MTKGLVRDLEILEDDLYEFLLECDEKGFDKTNVNVSKLWEAWAIMRKVYEEEHNKLEG